MPKPKKPRKPYRPKGIRVDMISYVLSGLKPVLSHESATNMRIRNHAAMTALIKGTATKDDIDVLIFAFNITEGLALVNPKLGSDWRAEIKAGQDALFDVALRGKARQWFVITGPEMAAMNLTMDIHEAQLEQATVLEIERAADLVHQRVKTN